MSDLIVYQNANETCIKAWNEPTPFFSSSQASETIQKAIDTLAADGGGEIRLMRGRYALSRPVELKNAVAIAGSGRATTLHPADDWQGEAILFANETRGASVSNFCINGQDLPSLRNGIEIATSGECEIEKMKIARLAGNGILLRDHAFLCNIRHCSLAGNREAAIRLQSLAKGPYGDFLPSSVQNCLIYGGGKGIVCDNAIVVNLTGNTVYQTKGPAFHLCKVSNSVLISGCRTFQIGAEAVLCEDSHELNVSSNIFCWHEGPGIRTRNARWGTISGNEIIDSGSYNPGGPDQKTPFAKAEKSFSLQNGIELLDTRGYSLTGNTIFSWHVCPKMRNGIYEDAESSKNLIADNQINFYEEAAVASHGSDTRQGENVSLSDTTHIGEKQTEFIQSFQTKLTEKFIKELYDI